MRPSGATTASSFRTRPGGSISTLPTGRSWSGSRRLALECWRLFGLRGWARVDFRVDAAGQPWILEVNANPCLSPDAGFAAALARSSISFDEAIRRILEDCRMTDQPIELRYDVRPDDRQSVRRLVESTGVFSPVEVDVAVELVDERLAEGPQERLRVRLCR